MIRKSFSRINVQYLLYHQMATEGRRMTSYRQSQAKPLRGEQLVMPRCTIVQNSIHSELAWRPNVTIR